MDADKVFWQAVKRALQAVIAAIDVKLGSL